MRERFTIQRRWGHDTWRDGTAHHRAGYGEYPFVFKTQEEGEHALANARRRAKSWGHSTEFRLVRSVTTYEVIG